LACQDGKSRDEAIAKAETLGLRVIADRIEHGEQVPAPVGITIAAT